MAYHDRRLSLCHFASTRLAFSDDKNIYRHFNRPVNQNGSNVLCDYCNQPCEFVPDFLTDDLALELTMRRYKDNDLKFEDAQDIIKGQIKGTILELLATIGKLKNAVHK